MSDPLNELDQVESALDLARDAAVSYLGNIGEAPVLDGGAEKTIDSWQDPVPEEGDGSLAALTDLAARAEQSATRSSGPRFFHFVMGGGTPAALGADWLTSAL